MDKALAQIDAKLEALLQRAVEDGSSGPVQRLAARQGIAGCLVSATNGRRRFSPPEMQGEGMQSLWGAMMRVRQSLNA